MTYEQLVALARDDPNVLGLVLTGSRGAGALVRDDSDWDVRLVVRDDVLDEYRSKLATPHGSQVEVVVFFRTEFEHVGQPGSPRVTSASSSDSSATWSRWRATVASAP